MVEEIHLGVINPLLAKLSNLHFHSLEDVCRGSDTKL